MWIQWPGTSGPQKYKALVDTGAQCALLPSGDKGTEPICVSGVTEGSQQLNVLEAGVSLSYGTIKWGEWLGWVAGAAFGG